MKEKIEYILLVFEVELKKGHSVHDSLIIAFDDMACVYELKPEKKPQNINTKINIELDIKGQNISLTVEELRQLKTELDNLFNNHSITYP